jgi:hypothetical protein
MERRVGRLREFPKLQVEWYEGQARTYLRYLE